jgi:tetratricopeptide (TPR) repeat protein
LGEGRTWLETLLKEDTHHGGVASQETRARALHAAAGLARDQGDYARATRLYEEARALRQTLGDKRGAATSLQQRGAVAFDQGDHDGAAALLQESLQAFRALEWDRGVAISLNYLGCLARDRGDFDSAAHSAE